MGTPVCRRCGSLRTRVIGGGLVERVLALLLRQHVVVCARCGFRGRQGKAGGSAPDGVASRGDSRDPRIDLAELDRALDRGVTKKPSRTGDK